MADSEKQPASERPGFWYKPGSTKAERQQALAEWNAKAFVRDLGLLLKEYEEADPEAFILGKMLASLRDLEKELRRAQQVANRETDPGKRMKNAMDIVKIQKRQMDTITAISKYRDGHQSRAKAARGNKSAAPGQQVGQPMTPPANVNGAKPVCETTPNSRF